MRILLPLVFVSPFIHDYPICPSFSYFLSIRHFPVFLLSITFLCSSYSSLPYFLLSVASLFPSVYHFPIFTYPSFPYFQLPITSLFTSYPPLPYFLPILHFKIYPSFSYLSILFLSSYISIIFLVYPYLNSVLQTILLFRFHLLIHLYRTLPYVSFSYLLYFFSQNIHISINFVCPSLSSYSIFSSIFRSSLFLIFSLFSY